MLCFVCFPHLQSSFLFLQQGQSARPNQTESERGQRLNIMAPLNIIASSRLGD